MLSKHQFLQSLAQLRGTAMVVTTMGIVRPWGIYSRSEFDFASADSAMGHAADLALGLALAQPQRKVICLNGDGSMLMALGFLATIVQTAATNFVLFVVQNDTYEITGNQPLPGAGQVDFVTIARGAGFSRSYLFEDITDYIEKLPEVLEGEGPVFVSVKVQAGSEGPLSRSQEEEAPYLRPSLAESAHRLRKILNPLSVDSVSE
jgi:thiamine pyrophosphate-dependent acetolactate synthase large subunit-like protein